jgi:methionyl-tRNA formyltransferase
VRPLRLVFAGTPEFSVPALDALLSAGYDVAAVYTQPDRPAGRGRALTASPVKQRALERGLVIEQPATLRDGAAIARLTAYRPDVMIVVAYGLILPPDVLGLRRLGCLNFHASLLPRWRGAAPIQRAIEAGDAETGVTIMQMDAGLDTGPILLTRRTRIDSHDTSGTLHERLAQLGAEAIVAALEAVGRGELEARPQPQTGATYAAKLRKEDAEIEWSRSAAQIDAGIRAFNPWPVATTHLGGDVWRVWQASPRAEAVSAEPGRIVRAEGGELLVATGDGTLALQVLQLPGRRVATATDFLNAWRGEPLLGQRLGP